MSYRLIHKKPDGTESVIKTGLSEKEAINYFYGIDNTYYEEEEEPNDERVD